MAPEKIFTVLSNYGSVIEDNMNEVNNFLRQRPNYEVKSITPIKGGTNNEFGVIVVVRERQRRYIET